MQVVQYNGVNGLIALHYDDGKGLVVDSTGNVYIVGQTNASSTGLENDNRKC